MAAWVPVASAAAQRPDSAARLTAGARVRVVHVDGARHVGRIVAHAGDSLHVQLERGDTLILPAGAPLEISLGRTGTAKWTGAAIGLGAVIVTAAVLTTSSTAPEEYGPLGPVGALVGGLIGSRIKRERWVSARAHGVRDAP